LKYFSYFILDSIRNSTQIKIDGNKKEEKKQIPIPVNNLSPINLNVKPKSKAFVELLGETFPHLKEVTKEELIGSGSFGNYLFHKFILMKMKYNSFEKFNFF